MKLSCGETWEAKEERLSNWHDKFLWFQTVIGTRGDRYDCRWLETVQRKGEYRCCWDNGYWVWDYRELPK